MAKRRKLPDTEKKNPRTAKISFLSTRKIVEMIHTEDIRAYEAVGTAIDSISEVIDECFKRVDAGGRVIYVGAGTSGRVGAQDAIEMWPTYGLGKETFDFVIAGGNKTLSASVEGAEDSRGDALEILRKKKITRNDCVIGITASGRTAFVQAAVKMASGKGCYTAAIVNSRNSPLSEFAGTVVFLDTGPEVIQGSTRMKAATAQKMALNIISTSLAIKLGRTYGNEMFHMKASYNRKLKDRATRMISERFRISSEEAEKRLESHGYNLVETVDDLEDPKKG
jgi:N-acetylmuramic acid 6-phosphate etherase